MRRWPAVLFAVGALAYLGSIVAFGKSGTGLTGRFPGAFVGAAVSLLIGFGLLATVVLATTSWRRRRDRPAGSRQALAARQVSAARLAHARRFADQAVHSTVEERRAVRARVPSVPAMRLEARPDAEARRARVRRLAWRHTGWTMLLAGVAWSGALFQPDWALALRLMPVGLALYGVALVAATRGPVADVVEAPAWMQQVFLWRRGRNGLPLLLPAVALLPLGLLVLQGGL